MKLLSLLITFTNVNCLIRIDSPKVAGVNARSLESTVVGLIEDFSRKVIEHGFDPYFVERTEYETTIVPNFLRIHISLDDLLFTGASNAVINDLKFSVKKHTLFVEVTLPQIYYSVEELLADIIIYGRHYKTYCHGSVAFNELRLATKITFVAGSESLQVKDVFVKFVLGYVSSNIESTILGVPVGAAVNKFMDQEFPKIMKNNSDYRDDDWRKNIMDLSYERHFNFINGLKFKS